jgi:hypothetical protein
MIGYMLALLAMLMLMPNIRGRRSYWFTDLRNLHTPAFFSQGEYKQVLKPGDNVIVLPYGNQGYSMLWQTTSAMYFRMAGGYVTAYIPSTFAQSPVVQMFYSGKPAPGARNDLANFCEAKDVRAVILAADVAGEWDWALRAIGWERIETGGVVIYRTPSKEQTGVKAR